MCNWKCPNCYIAFLGTIYTFVKQEAQELQQVELSSSHTWCFESEDLAQMPVGHVPIVLVRGPQRNIID